MDDKPNLSDRQASPREKNFFEQRAEVNWPGIDGPPPVAGMETTAETTPKERVEFLEVAQSLMSENEFTARLCRDYARLEAMFATARGMIDRLDAEHDRLEADRDRLRVSLADQPADA
jgi:hypothetical protein